MNGIEISLPNRIAVLALIGLRALAEYDPAEYARVTDASKGDIDERIRSLLDQLGDGYGDERLDGEIRDKYSQLRAIGEESRGRTEFVFLLRQLHMSSLERAQQLSLRYDRVPRPLEVRSSPSRFHRAALSRKDIEPRSEHDEFLRLAVMRLLRDLPGYSPLFEIAASDRQIDCVLTPASADQPAVVIEAKLHLRPADTQQVFLKARRAATAWGKGSIPAVICPALDRPWNLPPESNAQTVYFLQFDTESNSFTGQGAAALFARLQAYTESSSR